MKIKYTIGEIEPVEIGYGYDFSIEIDLGDGETPVELRSAPAPWNSIQETHMRLRRMAETETA